ncbi:AAA family ATPase [Paenibacillus sp. S150]|uniref:AAA family ATPase n=1 Tax=Paenibacillus sp. S150 TaxID=2749826 RepID=UPI001C5681B5|nr:AAA family ATPase [Paenibacillus sp. S150]MBW4081301.1 AAA family ATPase [Paenibacillus sp. S150]
MEVALFRPIQRQAWVDKLRRSGYTVKFVHDLERLSPSLDIVVVDTAVAKWKDYVRMVKEKGIPIVLLIEGSAPLRLERFPAMGIAGTVTPAENTDQLFSRFVKQRNEAVEAIGEALAVIQKQEQAGLPDDNSQKRETLLPLSRRKMQSENNRELKNPIQDLSSGEETHRLGSPSDGSEHPFAFTTVEVVNQGNTSAENEHVDSDSHESNPLAIKGFMKEVDHTENGPKPDAGTEDREHPPVPLSQKRKLSPDFPELDSDAGVIAGEIREKRKIESFESVPQLALPFEKQRDLPSVVTVYAPKGGVGKTVFLLHLAAVLAKENCRVCLLDLDVMHGTVASTLQLSPAKTIADLVRRIDDPKASRACLLPMKMGFCIVAAPEKTGTFALRQEQLPALFHFLKAETDVVLVDLSSRFDPIVKMALEQSDVLLLMTTPDPASIDSLKRAKPLLSSLLPSPDTAIIGNRLSEPLPKDYFQNMLYWPVLLELSEEAAVAAAVRRGELALRSSYSQLILGLVRQWLGMEATEPAKGKNSLAKLFLRMR